jgi:hypothetical protein
MKIFKTMNGAKHLQFMRREKSGIPENRSKSGEIERKFCDIQLKVFTRNSPFANTCY